MLGFEVSNLGYAGAFVVGALAGAIIVVRVLRVAISIVRGEDNPKP